MQIIKCLVITCFLLLIKQEAMAQDIQSQYFTFQNDGSLLGKWFKILTVSGGSQHGSIGFSGELLTFDDVAPAQRMIVLASVHDKIARHPVRTGNQNIFHSSNNPPLQSLRWVQTADNSTYTGTLELWGQLNFDWQNSGVWFNWKYHNDGGYTISWEGGHREAIGSAPTGNGTYWDFLQGQTFADNGNAGIGVGNPHAPLHLAGSGVSRNTSEQYNGQLIIQANTGRSGESGAQLEFAIPANTDGSNLWGQARILTVAGNAGTSNATGKILIGTRRYFNKLGSGNSWYYCDDLTIDGTGNVGIGTIDPGAYKLAVEGKLGARKLVVTQASWADYVFDSTYQLKSLSEVEKYIEQHKHLPDIPSAKEVKENGLDVGENQALLLKKIEEQMLYILELNKEIKSLRQEINQLKNK